MALFITAFCAILAAFSALRRLRRTAMALRFQPAGLMVLMRSGDREALLCLERALASDGDTWEAALVREVVGADSAEAARAEMNSALMEMDGKLSFDLRFFAAIARISVFGCLIGAAVLFMAGQGLTISVLDVFAIGAAGVIITLSAAKEAQRLARCKRQQLDNWAELLLGVGNDVQ